MPDVPLTGMGAADAKWLCLVCNEKSTPLGHAALRRVGAETETDVGAGNVLDEWRTSAQPEGKRSYGGPPVTDEASAEPPYSLRRFSERCRGAISQGWGYPWCIQ